jgi:hypothetical protein
VEADNVNFMTPKLCLDAGATLQGNKAPTKSKISGHPEPIAHEKLLHIMLQRENL